MCHHLGMASRDASVLDGRNPAWREAWEGLDHSARTQVTDAVKNATRIEAPELKPFVSGLIAKTRRGLRSKTVNLVVLLILTGFWSYATAVMRPSPTRFFWISLFVFLLIVGPVFLRAKFRRLEKAEQAQSLG
jgi:hypothetical protein